MACTFREWHAPVFPSPQDPQYIQQALTNVLLMDAVVGALQSSKIIYAASKLAVFDKLKNEGELHCYLNVLAGAIVCLV